MDAQVPTQRIVAPLLRRPPAMRDDYLVLVQEHVRHCHALVQQPTGIVAEIQDQPAQRGDPQALERVGQFAVGGLVEGRKAYVADARPQ